MRLLAAVFSTPEEFLGQYSPDYPSGALFYPTRAKFALQERVLCEVRFPGLPNPTIVRGRVITALDGRGALIACADEDAKILAYIVATAKGDLPKDAGFVRHHPRFPARVPVVFRISERAEVGNDIDAVTSDLGSGGAFVCATETPQVGTRVSLRLTRTGRGPIEVEGWVAWARPGEGFGVRFDQRGPASAAPLRPMIRKIRETGEVPIWAGAHADQPRAETGSPLVPPLR